MKLCNRLTKFCNKLIKFSITIANQNESVIDYLSNINFFTEKYGLYSVHDVAALYVACSLYVDYNRGFPNVPFPGPSLRVSYIPLHDQVQRSCLRLEFY